MGNTLWSFFSLSCYRRLAKISFPLWILISIPCGLKSNELLVNVENFDSNRVVEHFDALYESIHKSQDKIDESRKFLLSFINDINRRYNLSLTLQEACTLIEQNLYTLPLTADEKSSLLFSIDLLHLSDKSLEMEGIAESHRLHLYWPWEWNWFGLNKKPHKEKCDYSKKSPGSVPQKELPANCYVGAVELFSGVLIFFLPFPGAQALATGAVADGLRRVFDGIIQLSEERRLDPNYRPPSFE